MYKLETGVTINLISAPCFLATKVEAFIDPNREGHNDIFISRDFQDIVSVIDSRRSVVSEALASPMVILQFLRQRFSWILEQRYLEEAIASYVDDGREELVVERLRRIANA